MSQNKFGSKSITRKATMYIRRMDSDQLAEIMQKAFELYKELNPSRFIKYCRLDRSRIFWAMWENRNSFDKGYRAKNSGIIRVEDKYIDRGLIKKAVAEEAGESLDNDFDFSYMPVYITERKDLKKYYQKLNAEKRAARPKARTKDANVVEFVYSTGYTTRGEYLDWLDGIPEYSPFDLDIGRVVLTYRVIKKTKKGIFISKTPEEGQTNNEGYLTECFTLNREAFERDGEHYSRPAKKRFYKNKNAAIVSGNENLFEMLDIEGKITKKTLRAAYLNKAKELHPDKGGNAEAFVRLKESYETFVNAMG